MFAIFQLLFRLLITVFGRGANIIVSHDFKSFICGSKNSTHHHEQTIKLVSSSRITLEIDHEHRLKKISNIFFRVCTCMREASHTHAHTVTKMLTGERCHDFLKHLIAITYAQKTIKMKKKKH